MTAEDAAVGEAVEVEEVLTATAVVEVVLVVQTVEGLVVMTAGLTAMDHLVVVVLEVVEVSEAKAGFKLAPKSAQEGYCP